MAKIQGDFCVLGERWRSRGGLVAFGSCLSGGQGGNFQHDVDPFFLGILRGGIELTALLFQDFHSLPNGDIIQIHAIQDNRIQFSQNCILGGGPVTACEGGGLGGAVASTELANGFFPLAIHQPKHAAASLVVGLIVVSGALLVDLLHAIACGGVVWVEIQNLLVALRGQIVAPGGIKALGLVQQGLHLVAFGGEFRIEGGVEISLLQLGKDSRSRLVTRVEFRGENGFGDILGFGVIAPLDQIPRIVHGGFAEVVENRLAIGGGRGACGNQAQSFQIIFVSFLEVIGFHGPVSPVGHSLAAFHIFLTADFFPLGEVDEILGDCRCGDQKDQKEKNKSNEGLARTGLGREFLPVGIAIAGRMPEPEEGW